MLRQADLALIAEVVELPFEESISLEPPEPTDYAVI